MNAPPDLFQFSGNVDEWEQYLDEVYETYLGTLIRDERTLWGKPLRARYAPAYRGKHFCFWHLISEGRDEDERTPDMRRCARIAWIRWIVDNADDDEVFCWERTVATRNGQRKRWTLWVRPHDYAVIVEERATYMLLITAFIVEPHRRRTYERELGL